MFNASTSKSLRLTIISTAFPAGSAYTDPGAVHPSATQLPEQSPPRNGASKTRAVVRHLPRSRRYYCAWSHALVCVEQVFRLLQAPFRVPCRSWRDIHSSRFICVHSSKACWVFLSALTMIVFSNNCKLLMVFIQANTDSTEAYSATPKEEGRAASATERFQEVRLPHAFSRRSSRELDT